jgi:amidophosphoribosyltransferase
MREECGIYGAYLKNREAYPYIVEGLISLQHRGQESFGIVTVNESFKRMGMITSNTEINKIFLRGNMGIGHVRYSTKGRSNIQSAQPFKAHFKGEDFAIAHNGQVEEAERIKKELEDVGTLFLTDSDTELILHILIKTLPKNPSKWTLEEISKTISENIGSSYSLLIMVKNRLIALRDGKGYRPLFLCKAKDGCFVSSEDCAFKNIESVEYVREIKAGEAVEIKEDGTRSVIFERRSKKSYCFFEQIYFSRPDSNIFGLNVHNFRERLGEECAIEYPVDADVVVPVMDSGFSAALGYSRQSKIPLEMGLMKNKYIGRTFINPLQKDRKKGVMRKLSPIREVIKGKSVILVDDSMVRGTTMESIISILKDSGAREVHVRIASPMVKNVCKWGVDIPMKEHLIAHSKSLDEITKSIKADSVGYVSLEGIKKILGDDYKDYCFHCFKEDD